MKEEKINEMWKEIMKLTIGEKSDRYMVEFLSEDERLEIRKEYLQWCENYSKTSTGGWSACMSYEYSKEAQRDIIKKHVKESVVTLSVDGRNALMKKVMDMAEKLLARFGLDMPAIKWQTYNVSTVKKDRLTLNALDFLYRGANETEDTVIERCMNLFFAYVYFYGEGVKEYFDAHGLTYTKRTGKGYDAWKKMVLEDMATVKEEKSVEQEEPTVKEEKTVGYKKVEKTDDEETTLKKMLWNQILSCYESARIIKKEDFIRYLDKAVNGWYDWLCDDDYHDKMDFGEMKHFIDNMGDDSDSYEAAELFDNHIIEWHF